MNIIEIIISILLLIADRIMKYQVLNTKSSYRFFSWFYIKGSSNTGLAFSLFDNKMTMYVVIAAFLMFFAWLVVMIYKKHYLYGSYLILFGGASNLFDRFYYKGVVDYIRCTCFSRPLPVFNIADMMIVCGVVFALFSLLNQKKMPKKIK